MVPTHGSLVFSLLALEPSVLGAGEKHLLTDVSKESWWTEGAHMKHFIVSEAVQSVYCRPHSPCRTNNKVQLMLDGILAGMIL